MKIIKYRFMSETNRGTEENPDIVQTFNACEIKCSDDVFESNLAIAKAEAYNGEVTVEDVPDPEPAAPSQAEELAEFREQLKAQQAIINALLGEE